MTKPLKDKVADRLQALGRNPFEAARSVELERGFINDILQDKKRSVRGENLQKLARALDWTVADLLDEVVAPPRPRLQIPLAGAEVELPIRYEVAAGAWRAVDEAVDEPLGFAPAPRIPAYEAFPQWYEKVVGDSFNRLIPEGALVHVVDAVAMGYSPRHEDVVVVQRARAGGSFRERTLKQVAMTADGVELWPRSHNPKWSEPLRISRDIDPREDATVEIVGKVVRAYIGF